MLLLLWGGLYMPRVFLLFHGVTGEAFCHAWPISICVYHRVQTPFSSFCRSTSSPTTSLSLSLSRVLSWSSNEYDHASSSNLYHNVNFLFPSNLPVDILRKLRCYRQVNRVDFKKFLYL